MVFSKYKIIGARVQERIKEDKIGQMTAVVLENWYVLCKITKKKTKNEVFVETKFVYYVTLTYVDINSYVWYY